MRCVETLNGFNMQAAHDGGDERFDDLLAWHRGVPFLFGKKLNETLTTRRAKGSFVVPARTSRFWRSVLDEKAYRIMTGSGLVGARRTRHRANVR